MGMRCLDSIAFSSCEEARVEADKEAGSPISRIIAVDAERVRKERYAIVQLTISIFKVIVGLYVHPEGSCGRQTCSAKKATLGILSPQAAPADSFRVGKESCLGEWIEFGLRSVVCKQISLPRYAPISTR